ncbi:HNH endonuclease [Pseudomonas sp. lyk4-TYG-107]|uniref:HNH endonuclease n=1 Tax=Pseudomonas sp. lyk4-TYG-107 TaxID=3040317 RepID=UPI003307C1AF
MTIKTLKFSSAEKSILDSVMPGGENWANHQGSCLNTCSYFLRCKGAGPAQKVCSSKWQEAPLNEDTMNVFIHVLGSFDYYDQGDFARDGRTAEVISKLQSRFMCERDELREGSSFAEGSKVLKSHLRTERNGRIGHELKLQRMNDQQSLTCAACETDFYALLGSKATRVIECHHQLPLSHEAHTGETDPDDLVLLCANCHRIAHTDDKLLRIEELRRFIRFDRAPPV